MRMGVWSLASLSGLRIRRCRELWYRLHTQLRFCIAVLWCRLVAVALIGPLAWETPYAMGVALKRPKKKNKNKKKPCRWLTSELVVNYYMLFPKTGNRARVSTLTKTFNSKCLTHCNKARKRNKRHTDWEKWNKTISICKWHNCLCRKSERTYKN